MNNAPDNKPTEDDAEGHLYRSGRLDAEAVTEDDVEGHAMRSGRLDAEAVTEDDDVEGHAMRSGRFDAEAVTEDDVEGHRIYARSDTNVKADQTQVEFDDDGDDTQGHAFKAR